MATLPTTAEAAIITRLMEDHDPRVTEHALAIRTGISLSTLRRRLAGADFTASELHKIAQALGTTASAILAEAETSAA
jgi:hypothetical protein